MTETTLIELATKAADRVEAVTWLADRVRWESVMAAFRETPDPTSHLDDVEEDQAA